MRSSYLIPFQPLRQGPGQLDIATAVLCFYIARGFSLDSSRPNRRLLRRTGAWGGASCSEVNWLSVLVVVLQFLLISETVFLCEFVQIIFWEAYFVFSKLLIVAAFPHTSFSHHQEGCVCTAT